MGGFSSTPATTIQNANNAYMFRIALGSTVEIWENGSSVLSLSGTAYNSTTVFSVIYDGRDIIYYINGGEVRRVARNIGSPLYLLLLIYTSAYSQINNIYYGPVGELGSTGPTGPVGATGPGFTTITYDSAPAAGQVLITNASTNAANAFSALTYNSTTTLFTASNILAISSFTTSNIVAHDILATSTFSLGLQNFYSQGADGFSVNDNVNTGNETIKAYHFSSGDANRDIIVSLGKPNSSGNTDSVTNMIGTYGNSTSNTFVIASEKTETNFEFRTGVGIGSGLNIGGIGTQVFNITGAGEIYAPIMTMAQTSDVVYYNSTDGEISYGPSPFITGYGGVAQVDLLNGDDTTASIGGTPFSTVEGAIAAASGIPGSIVFIYPGQYTIAAAITIPEGVTIHGESFKRVSLTLEANADTTFITMGTNSSIEEVELVLYCAGHQNLTGITFPYSTPQTSKVRNCILTVINEQAESTGTSDIIGIEAGSLLEDTQPSLLSYCIEGCTINISSNGAGIKRGIYIFDSVGFASNTARDIVYMGITNTNIYVLAPATNTSTGSYVGVEVNNNDNGNAIPGEGRVRLHNSAISVVLPVTANADAFTASDILQTMTNPFTTPNYREGPGILIGPGTELVTKTAGSKGFSVYNYTSSVYYGIRGTMISGTSGGYLWPGTMLASSGATGFPDTSTPPAHFRVQQTALICGITCSLKVAPGTGGTLTVLVRVTPNGGSIASTNFTVVFGAADTFKSFYDASLSVNTGDRIHVQVSWTGGSNTARDLTVQLDMF